VADFLVICGGESERQVKAISANVLEGLKKLGERPLGVEGFEAGRWVLMDYGDVLLHVFLTRLRTFYDLEGLWADAPRVATGSAQRETEEGTAARGPLADGPRRG
jgi:ribosome-associated protein